MTKPRVAVVTGGHLSTCPRMLKAAEALAADGFDVHVVSTRSTAWAIEADAQVLERRKGLFRSTVVDYTRNGAPLTWLRSGARRKLARALAAAKTPVPFALATRAFARVHDELVSAAAATGADLFYGGTTGGIAAAFAAARRLGRPYALDLEDFFTGEPEAGSLDRKLAERVEVEILAGARFLTAASEAIALAYQEKYGVAPAVVHNAFPLPEARPVIEPRPEGPLRLYWFSQTIGPGRGLEQAVAACGLAGVDAELTLRGAMAPGFGRALSSLAGARAKHLRLVVLPPGPPDEMTRLAAGHHVGLSLEQGTTENRLLCSTNKAFVYMLAGLALALTDTPGQRPLLRDLEGFAVAVPTGDVTELARGFRRLALDREWLRACRETAFAAAARRWHWESDEERGRLLALFADDQGSTRTTKTK